MLVNNAFKKGSCIKSQCRLLPYFKDKRNFSVTCSIRDSVAEPKCKTRPSAGETRLALSMTRTSFLSVRVKNSERLRYCLNIRKDEKKCCDISFKRHHSFEYDHFEVTVLYITGLCTT